MWLSVTYKHLACEQACEKKRKSAKHIEAVTQRLAELGVTELPAADGMQVHDPPLLTLRLPNYS